MFKRVMVAVFGIPFLLLVLAWAPDWATMLLLAAMCAIGAHELMHAAGGEKGRRLLPLTGERGSIGAGLRLWGDGPVPPAPCRWSCR